MKYFQSEDCKWKDRVAKGLCVLCLHPLWMKLAEPVAHLCRIDLIQRTTFSVSQGPFGHCVTGTDHAALLWQILDGAGIFGYACMVFLL